MMKMVILLLAANQDTQQLSDDCVRAGGKANRCQQQYASVSQRTGNERPYVSPLAYRKSDRQ